MKRVAIAWAIAMLAAGALDWPIAVAMHHLGIDGFLESQPRLSTLLKLPGFFGTTVLIAIVLTKVHPLRGWSALFLVACAATTSTNQLLKWIVGRTRPYRTLSGNSDALAPFELYPFQWFDAKNLCFPSGHAALAFATAASLSILWPRQRWVFYALAGVVGVERVLSNAHWLSDVIAAAALGIGGVWCVRRLWWDGFARNFSNARSTLPLAGHPGL